MGRRGTSFYFFFMSYVMSLLHYSYHSNPRNPRLHIIQKCGVCCFFAVEGEGTGREEEGGGGV